MILDKKQIQELTRKGVKLTTADGKAIRIETPRKEESELDYLKTISALLSQLIAKPDPVPASIRPPDVIVKPADVTVKPPDVIVNQPISIPIRKWKFEVIKDFQGFTTEIIATAME